MIKRSQSVGRGGGGKPFVLSKVVVCGANWNCRTGRVCMNYDGIPKPTKFFSFLAARCMLGLPLYLLECTSGLDLSLVYTLIPFGSILIVRPFLTVWRNPVQEEIFRCKVAFFYACFRPVPFQVRLKNSQYATLPMTTWPTDQRSERKILNDVPDKPAWGSHKLRR